MSREGVVALAAERVEVLRLYRSLSPDEWALPSGCPGWSVQDVLAHMASLFHPTPTLLRSARGGADIEDLNDRLVEERRGWSSARQLTEYQTWSRRALHLLDALQRRPLTRIPVPLGNLGTHRAARLVDAAAFDHYTHLRFDLVGPRGPLDRPPPPADPLRLRPVLSWMLTILPVCSDPSLARLDRWVQLSLLGPGGGRSYVGPPSAASGGLATLVVGGEPPGSVAATISADSAAFPGWATHRTTWRDPAAGVDLSGDLDLARHVADAIHVF